MKIILKELYTNKQHTDYVSKGWESNAMKLGVGDIVNYKPNNSDEILECRIKKIVLKKVVSILENYTELKNMFGNKGDNENV